MDIKTKAGKALQDARKSKGMNQDGVAKLMNASRGYISNLERGVTLNLESMSKYLNALDCEIDFYVTSKK